MSALLRTGASLEMIEKAFSGVSPCPSFTRERGKGNHLSDGSYCGMAILKEIKAVLKQQGFDKNEKEEKKSFTPIDLNVKKEKKEKFSKEEKDFLDKHGELEYAKKFNKCPSCNENLVNSGGCITCMSGCGWSKCN